MAARSGWVVNPSGFDGREHLYEFDDARFDASGDPLGWCSSASTCFASYVTQNIIEGPSRFPAENQRMRRSRHIRFCSVRLNESVAPIPRTVLADNNSAWRFAVLAPCRAELFRLMSRHLRSIWNWWAMCQCNARSGAKRHDHYCGDSEAGLRVRRVSRCVHGPGPAGGDW